LLAGWTILALALAASQLELLVCHVQLASTATNKPSLASSKPLQLLRPFS
jgi:hypothetical protein